MPQPIRRPRALKPGDTVAVVSPSSGTAHAYPHIYAQGLATLRGWGLRIKEYPTTRMSNEELARHPEWRARDVNHAFADPDVAAIIASIGGDDCMRTLPWLDDALIGRNPKILLGYSDTTTLLWFAHMQGMVTFHGPSVMAGLAQSAYLPAYYRQHYHQMLFSPRDTYTYQSALQYSDGYLGWHDTTQRNRPKPWQYSRGWQWLQGRGQVRGRLVGGCIEVLEFTKGTRYWPAADFWYHKILFLEMSEEKPTLLHVERWLRNYGLQGAFDRISGLVFGRPYGYTVNEQIALDAMIVRVVRDEFGAKSLPIVTNFDVGHTEPQLIVPLGVLAELDCERQTIMLCEPWLRPADGS